MRRLLIAAVLGILATGRAEAAQVLTYSIQDAATFLGYSSPNLNATYSGTGFVGQYNNGFAHIFGLETGATKTDLQVGISDLAGRTITSAILSYNIETFSPYNPGPLTATTTATSYNSGGVLAYNFNNTKPALGFATGTLVAGQNQIDVTSLLISAVTAGQGYFGLHLESSGGVSAFTYTNQDGRNADSANVRLTVTTADVVSTPEPASLISTASGLVALGLYGYRRSRRKAG